MANHIYSVITGTGCYIPTRTIPNKHFLDYTFLDDSGAPYKQSNQEIIQKFEEITGIKERRYAKDDLLASDMAAIAGKKAIQSANIDAESLDYIIVAHNFGDVRANNVKVDMVPNLAARVKQHLNITNPFCIAYDLPFGCPGWLQGIIQADYFLKSGDASRALVIGAETLSRVCDPHDRDSMIYADGAGATILEAFTSSEPAGILAHSARTDTGSQAYYLNMNTSSNPEHDDTLYLKMKGHKLYQYALSHVPNLVKKSLDKAGITIKEVDKLLIHQANTKMDRAILNRILNLYDCPKCSEDLMPMTLSWLGNSSVATVPTLLDLIQKGKLEGQHIQKRDILTFASVGAGMNINAMVYKVPE